MLRLRVGNMTCGDWTESVDAPLKKGGMEAGTQPAVLFDHARREVTFHAEKEALPRLVETFARDA